MFNEEQYKDAIQRLRDGMSQKSPDGDNCHVCHDSGHQAWECHHNPLFMEQLAWKIYGEFWKCFHCGEVFTDEIKAKEHFGDNSEVIVACVRAKFIEEGGRK